MKPEDFGEYEKKTFWEKLDGNQKEFYRAIFTIGIPWLFSAEGGEAAPHRKYLFDRAMEYYNAKSIAELWGKCMWRLEREICANDEEVLQLRIFHLDIIREWLPIENEQEFLAEAKENFLDQP